LTKLNVVATTADIGSIAKAIGDDRIDLSVLAKPTEDPHFVDAKPSLILKLNRADVVIEGGAELEIGWLPRLLDEARNTKLAAGAAAPGGSDREDETGQGPRHPGRSLPGPAHRRDRRRQD
jgi:zinc/manganese transport system substrate-binding protein